MEKLFDTPMFSWTGRIKRLQFFWVHMAISGGFFILPSKFANWVFDDTLATSLFAFGIWATAYAFGVVALSSCISRRLRDIGTGQLWLVPWLFLAIVQFILAIWIEEMSAQEITQETMLFFILIGTIVLKLVAYLLLCFWPSWAPNIGDEQQASGGDMNWHGKPGAPVLFGPKRGYSQ